MGNAIKILSNTSVQDTLEFYSDFQELIQVIGSGKGVEFLIFTYFSQFFIKNFIKVLF